MTAVIERISADDLIQLECDVGPVPLQVGGALLLESDQRLNIDVVRASIAERIVSIPRLRQRLVRLPAGCGRPIWVDDPHFDVSAHLRSVSCESPGDEAALLRTCAAVATAPLPWSRPPWSATLVDGLAGGRVALVVVFHHVMADGVGGLAVLAGLADGAISPGHARPFPFPRPRPSRRRLAADMFRSRVTALGRSVAGLPKLGAALAELNPAGVIRPAAMSALNRITGPSRSLAVVRTDLARVHDIAHAHGATVNDVVLTSIARALRELLARRGEALDHVVATVLVAARPGTVPTALGNVVGVMPVRLPTGGEPGDQIRRIAALTRVQKTAHRGASAWLLRPAFRLLALVHVLRWFINHQRLVNIFVTNLRGPDSQIRFSGAAVTDILPITMLTGNVGLCFAVMSYAGNLSVVVLSDPDCFPDHEAIAALVGRELDALTGALAGNGS